MKTLNIIQTSLLRVPLNGEMCWLRMILVDKIYHPCIVKLVDIFTCIRKWHCQSSS